MLVLGTSDSGFESRRPDQYFNGMKVFLNYLGQLRLYSLVDLVWLLLATQATFAQGLGVLFLWIGFLAHLELGHKHSYRTKLPKYLDYVLFLAGLLLFKKTEGILFIFLAYLYTKKKHSYWGVASPFLRGAQNFVLSAGIVGYLNPLSLFAFSLTLIRNFLGDLRDVKKDGEEGMKTIPVLLHMKCPWKYIHLAGVMATSAVWWSFTDVSVVFLFLVFAVQIGTYNLTPR